MQLKHYKEKKEILMKIFCSLLMCCTPNCVHILYAHTKKHTHTHTHTHTHAHTHTLKCTLCTLFLKTHTYTYPGGIVSRLNITVKMLFHRDIKSTDNPSRVCVCVCLEKECAECAFKCVCMCVCVCVCVCVWCAWVGAWVRVCVCKIGR